MIESIINYLHCMDEVKTSVPTHNEKLWAALGYVWVLSIVVLIMRKEKFVHDHAKQGLMLFVGECIIFVPIIGMLIGWLVGLIALVCAFVGFFKALQGESWKVPILGEIWDKNIQI